MANTVSPQDEQTLSSALSLSPSERVAMIEELAASLRVEEVALHEPTEPAFSDAEIAELTTLEPLSPAEVLAEGLLGTWSEMGISDGAEWVNEQKRKRRERRKW